VSEDIKSRFIFLGNCTRISSLCPNNAAPATYARRTLAIGSLNWVRLLGELASAGEFVGKFYSFGGLG
jgi:hypothetical protein